MDTTNDPVTLPCREKLTDATSAFETIYGVRLSQREMEIFSFAFNIGVISGICEKKPVYDQEKRLNVISKLSTELDIDRSLIELKSDEELQWLNQLSQPMINVLNHSPQSVFTVVESIWERRRRTGQ